LSNHRPAFSLICVDWGTTNLRAFALDEHGNIAEKRESESGIQNVQQGDFKSILNGLIQDWQTNNSESTLVLMSGMIGSRQGWLEAPYATCPVSPQDLIDGLVSVPDENSTWITPGICVPAETGRPDVMRGEETQVFGALRFLQRDDAVLCLPGTHSKWVAVDQGAITRFSTAMTGEVFHVMREHSILATLMTDNGEHDARAFGEGLKQSAEPGGLLNHLFTVRSKGLFNSLPGNALSSYLSGILIGHEIRELASLTHTESKEIILLGSSILSKRYAQALTLMGLSFVALDNDIATTQGLFSMAQQAGLIK